MHWWSGILNDFSDLPDLTRLIQITFRLTVAAGLGGVLGLERERAGKSAGLRTHMLVSLGAALFIVIPQQSGLSNSDSSRVIQGIVSGIGFLGAGAILKQSDEAKVEGLTTAAGLWLTAAVGIAAGYGRESTAILGTFLALIILSAFQHLADRIDPAEEKRSKKSKEH